jgi:endonuclease/exonuclease/phosphatase family metal-dependent hydrolase
LEGLEHDWFGRRFRTVVAGLRKYRPNVVCFQECTVRYAGGIYNQAQAIGEAADLNSVAFVPYGNPTSNEWTNPVARALLVGDFNATEQEPAIHLANERLKDAFRAVRNDDPGYTWVRSNPMNGDWRNMPDRRLDYIFCPRDVKVLRAELLFNGSDGAKYASDHFGLLADLECPATPKGHSIRRRARLHSDVKSVKEAA